MSKHEELDAELVAVRARADQSLAGASAYLDELIADYRADHLGVDRTEAIGSAALSLMAAGTPLAPAVYLALAIARLAEAGEQA